VALRPVHAIQVASSVFLLCVLWCFNWCDLEINKLKIKKIDLDSWHTNWSKRGTKHVYPVNLVQIHSAVPTYFIYHQKLQQRCFFKHKPHAGRRKPCFFVPGNLDLWPLTLTFKLVRARDQIRLLCEFGANPFSVSGDISYTNKKFTDGAKNRTLRSSLHVVKGLLHVPYKYLSDLQDHFRVF